MPLEVGEALEDVLTTSLKHALDLITGISIISPCHHHHIIIITIIIVLAIIITLADVHTRSYNISHMHSI